ETGQPATDNDLLYSIWRVGKNFLLRPETMHQVSIIVAKDQMPNLLSYAGREQVIHLVLVDDEKLPSGAVAFEATGLLSKSATIRNRISALSAALQPIE